MLRSWVQFLARAWACVTPGLDLCDPQYGHVQEATNQCFFLALMFLSLPLSLKAMKKMSSGEDKNFKKLCIKNIINKVKNKQQVENYATWKILHQLLLTLKVWGGSSCQPRDAEASRIWRREGKDSLLETPEGMQVCQHIVFNPVRSTPNL